MIIVLLIDLIIVYTYNDTVKEWVIFYKNVIGKTKSNKYILVDKITHQIPKHIANAERSSDFTNSDNVDF